MVWSLVFGNSESQIFENLEQFFHSFGTNFAGQKSARFSVTFLARVFELEEGNGKEMHLWTIFGQGQRELILRDTFAPAKFENLVRGGVILEAGLWRRLSSVLGGGWASILGAVLAVVWDGFWGRGWRAFSGEWGVGGGESRVESRG